MVCPRKDRLEKRVRCDRMVVGPGSVFSLQTVVQRKQELEVKEVRIVWTCPKTVTMEIYNNID